MKKDYQNFVLEIISFDACDVIVTSTYDPTGLLEKDPDHVWNFDELIES